jgi:hypothetical protein
MEVFEFNLTCQMFKIILPLPLSLLWESPIFVSSCSKIFVFTVAKCHFKNSSNIESSCICLGSLGMLFVIELPKEPRQVQSLSLLLLFFQWHFTNVNMV